MENGSDQDEQRGNGSDQRREQIEVREKSSDEEKEIEDNRRKHTRRVRLCLASD